MLLLLWGAVAVGAIYLYFKQKYSLFRRYGVKHYPAFPFLGNMEKLVLKINHFSDDIYRYYFDFPEERFVGKYEFLNPVVIIRDLELVKKITVKDFEYFLDHRSFMDEKTDPLFGKNLFSMKGQIWKDMRSTLSPAFTSSKMKHMVPFMAEAGVQMNKALRQKIDESGVAYIDVDIKDLTSRYANDVVASCAFGLKVDSHQETDNQFYTKGKEASAANFRQLLVFFGHTSFPKLMKAMKITLISKSCQDFFRKLVNSTMQDREDRNIFRPDMIHLLMEAKKGQLTHEEMKDEDAGFATVEESSVGKKTINRELLRLWPAGSALDRICTKEYNLGRPNDKATQDFIIRKGTGISIPVWGFHHDPQFYPDPFKFDPERFSEANKHSINPFTYMPFGVGPRNCIGSRFALCEIKVMAYQLLSQVEVSPCARTCLPAALSTDTFQLQMKGGHWLRMRTRP